MFGDKQKFSCVEWEDVVDIKQGKDYKSVRNAQGKYPVYGSGGIIDYADDFLCPANTVVVGRKGTINSPIWVKEPFWNIDTAFGVIPQKNVLRVEYLFYFCLSFDFMTLNKQITLPSLTRSDLLRIQISLPPLSLQNEFAAYVESVDKLRFREALINSATPS